MQRDIIIQCFLLCTTQAHKGGRKYQLTPADLFDVGGNISHLFQWTRFLWLWYFTFFASLHRGGGI